MRIKKVVLRFVFLTSYLLLLNSIFSSCIRLTGTAGVWKKGPQDAEPSSHKVAFDTAP